MISVIMPVYNEQEYILDAIQSIIEQNFTNFELIVVDDFSTDNTYELIKNYSNLDPRVKVFSPGKLGKNGAINYGVSKAKGEWFTIIAGDDLMGSGILHSWDMVAKNFNPMNKKIVISTRIRMFSDNKNYNKYDGIELPKNKNKAVKSGAAFLASKKTIDEMFPLPINYPNEDNWIALYFEFLIDEFVELPKVSINYRIHNNNSLNKNAVFEEFNEKYHSRIIILIEFLKRYQKSLNEADIKIIKTRIILEELRYKKNTLAIIKMNNICFKQKMRNVFLSNEKLYNLKLILNRLFLGN